MELHRRTEIADMIVAASAPSAALASHLAECDACRQYARDMEAAFHLTAYAVAIEAPPDHVKQAILRTARAGAAYTDERSAMFAVIASLP